MSLVITLDKHSFSSLFDQYNRSEQFSRCAREALFEYYDEDTTGDSLEVDIIGMCCDWAEYDNAELLREYYNYLPEELSDYEDEDDAASALIGALKDETTVIELSDGSTLVLAF